MTERVRCPRERRGKRGACERAGCNHLSGLRSRVCGCCLVQLGLDVYNRIYLLRKHGSDADLYAAETEALAKLNAMPPRTPIGTGWPVQGSHVSRPPAE